MSYETEIEEYKGHPMLVIVKGRWSFQFGMTKAKAILACLDQIRDFVEKFDKEQR